MGLILLPLLLVVFWDFFVRFDLWDTTGRSAVQKR